MLIILSFTLFNFFFFLTEGITLFNLNQQKSYLNFLNNSIRWKIRARAWIDFNKVLLLYLKVRNLLYANSYVQFIAFLYKFTSKNIILLIHLCANLEDHNSITPTSLGTITNSK